jgi:hypothetical protein
MFHNYQKCRYWQRTHKRQRPSFSCCIHWKCSLRWGHGLYTECRQFMENKNCNRCCQCVVLCNKTYCIHRRLNNITHAHICGADNPHEWRHNTGRMNINEELTTHHIEQRRKTTTTTRRNWNSLRVPENWCYQMQSILSTHCRTCVYEASCDSRAI